MKLFSIFLLTGILLWAGGSVTPVGSYLYANPDKLPEAKGSLSLSFSKPGPKRLVIAYGRKYRKDRKDREGTQEAEREIFKPRLASLDDNGRKAIFSKLPPDYYDIVVIDPETMTLFEGLSLLDSLEPPSADKAFQEEIRKSLGLREDRIGGWEGFFDHKAIARIETADLRAGVLIQQMRLGTALAESGAVLQGCIHSIDVVWVERSLDNGKTGWQVLNRQQLYRDEIPQRTFFRHKQLPVLNGIRIGLRPKILPELTLE